MAVANAAEAPATHRVRDLLLPAAGVFAWTVLVDVLFLLGDRLRASPISPLFFGDGLQYLALADHLRRGEAIGAGLPFHPPLTIWLLAPLWSLFERPEQVYLASKVLMAVLAGLTWAGVYVLLRGRLSSPLLVCLLAPLCFGELLLSQVANSEVPYRLLLVALLLLGRRWPVLGGALHAAAALTRAEHLMVIVLGGAIGLARPQTRRWAALTVGTAMLLLVPWELHVRSTIHAYNQRFAARLAAPLPEWVPISFYGPLNFSLAQREEGILFSRRTIPDPPSGLPELDPTFPPHRELIVHGYRQGFAAIAASPGRFVSRSLAKAGFALQALGYGWTWRDLPRPTEWLRPPVDMATSREPVWLGLSLLLVGIGAFGLRRQRTLLVVAGLLIAYRLLMCVGFFPYLRGMMIAAPAFLPLFFAGWQTLFRGAAPKLLLALLVLLGGYHLATAWQPRRLVLNGERTPAGDIIDDRPVAVRLVESGDGE